MSLQLRIAPTARLAALTGGLLMLGAASAQTPPANRSDLDVMLIVQEQVSQGGGCPALNVAYQMGGLSPQLGAVSGEGSHCAAPDATGNIGITEASTTLRMQSGDTLRLTYALLLTPGQTAPVYRVWGALRVVGGTGKYANASGFAVAHGLDMVQPQQNKAGPAILEIKGSITY